MNEIVTIGIPVFRAARYIRGALESALGQTYPKIEVLVIDDGSDDDSVAVVQQVQQSHVRGHAVRLVVHEHNQGVASTRNEIIDKAGGSMLYFMDADDVIRCDTIALLYAEMQSFDAEVVFGSYERIASNGQRQVYQYPTMHFDVADQLAAFAYRRYAGIQASACNILMRLKLLRDCQHRFVPADYWEDMVFTFDLVTLVSRAVLLPDVTYSYQCREGSLSSYQQRSNLPKSEVMRNVSTVGYLKRPSAVLEKKPYYAKRCLCVVMTDFYMACYVLKRRKHIVPAVTAEELKSMLAHPAPLSLIVAFPVARFKNLAFFLLGKLPAKLCVAAVWVVGKMKKLI